MTQITGTRNRLRRVMIWPFAIMLVISAAAGGWAALLQWTGNAHEVIKGELYRSARLAPAALKAYIRDHNIRSIINLEGHSTGRDWYAAELATSLSEGVAHADFSWSASRIVSVTEAEAFLKLASSLPKPILIHCRSGSDRTGLATALYLDFIAQAKDSDADAQLSFRFGHVGVPFTEAYAMDASWQNLHYQLEHPRRTYVSSRMTGAHPEI